MLTEKAQQLTTEGEKLRRQLSEQDGIVQAAMTQIAAEKNTNQQLLVQQAQLRTELELERRAHGAAADAAFAKGSAESRQAVAAAFKDGMAYAKEMFKDLKLIMA